MFKLFILFTALAFAGLSQAAFWKHLKLANAEGVGITLDYEMKDMTSPECFYKCEHRKFAVPLRVHVSESSLGPSDKVSVFLTSLKKNKLNNLKEEFSTQELELKYMGSGTFAIDIEALLIHIYGHAGTQHFSQEITVVINGQLLSSIGFKLFKK